MKVDFVSYVKVSANKENSTNSFQEYFSKQLLAGWNASYTTLDPLHILPQGDSKLGGRPTGFPPACQAEQAARASSQSDIPAFPFSTTTIGSKKLIQLSTFIFRSSLVKIVREKGSRVHHFLNQRTVKMEFAFLCSDDFNGVKSQAMRVIHEPQLALRRSLLEPKETGIGNACHTTNSRQELALTVFFSSVLSAGDHYFHGPVVLLAVPLATGKKKNVNQAWEKDASPKTHGMERNVIFPAGNFVWVGRTCHFDCEKEHVY